MEDRLHEGSISFDAAHLLCQAAVELAVAAGERISVAISDPGGELRAFSRMDGAAPLSGETARRKCRTVALTGRPSGEFGRIIAAELASEPELFHSMLGVGMFPIGGGVPVRVDGRTVAIVAVSGASSDADEQLARAAAAKIFGD